MLRPATLRVATHSLTSEHRSAREKTARDIAPQTIEGIGDKGARKFRPSQGVSLHLMPQLDIALRRGRNAFMPGRAAAFTSGKWAEKLQLRQRTIQIILNRFSTRLAQVESDPISEER